MFKENFQKIKKLPVLIFSILLFLLVINSISIKQPSMHINSNNIMKVIPSGALTGIKMYIDGVMIVGYSDVLANDGKIYKPAENAGLKEGDIIKKINEKTINNSNDLQKLLKENCDKIIEVYYERNDKISMVKITPILSKEDDKYHIGLWVKDGAVGIGTISLYNTVTDGFVALGHGITDIDTGKLVKMYSGNIVDAQIVGIRKGLVSKPGQLQGILLHEKINGEILKNNSNGIYGKYDEIICIDKYKEGIEVAKRQEIKLGEAIILTTIDKEIKEYKVKVKKIYKEFDKNNRNMVIQINDEELIKTTGGIIQGMSGSPIIQNNKLIGILTHVFVNDPTQGYAVFGDMMIEEMQNIE